MKSVSALKQAIVYIIDTSPSMERAYAQTLLSQIPTAHNSRLAAAKEALIGLITDLMDKSKTSEVGVIVLATSTTSHHLDGDAHDGPKQESEECRGGLKKADDDCTCTAGIEDKDEIGNAGNGGPNNSKYRNIVELSPVRRPSIELLRKIESIQVSPSPKSENDNHGRIPHRSGGFCDGIIIATSAIYQRTHNKKFQRKIILLTDAEREVDIDFDALDDSVQTLRDINCQLTVVGLDFQRSAETLNPVSLDSIENDDAQESARIKTKEEVRSVRIRDENEKFLISLTKFTSGTVHATSTVQQILKDVRGGWIPRSTLQKVELMVAPGLTFSARVSLSTSKANIPTLKREAIYLDDKDGNGKLKARKNSLGEVMTLPIFNNTTHWDADDADVEVELSQRATGYPYGSDLIPIGPLDMEGLKLRSPPRITILGYTSVKSIPISTWMGPTRIVSGDSVSRKACLAISAIAQALDRLEQIAICKYIQRKDAGPIMGFLSPLIENSGSICSAQTPTSSYNHKAKSDDNCNVDSKCRPRHLLFVRIPFAEDVQNITMVPFDEAVGDVHSTKSCDDLIDAFMLPPNALNCKKIANPAIRSFRRTVVQRAMDPSSDAIAGTSRVTRKDDNHQSQIDENDTMVTPKHIVDKGKNVLESFRQCFPLKVVNSDEQGKLRKKRFWDDIE